MLLLNVLFFTLCLYVSHGSESSEKLEALLSNPAGVKFLRNVLQQAYNEDKLEIISAMIRKLQPNIPNITVVGSQNIYGPNGEVVDVRTVELHIPQVNKDSLDGLSASHNKEDYDDDDDDDDNEDNFKILLELEKAFGEISKLGLSLEGAAEEYNKSGNVVTSGYIDNNLLHGYIEGINIVNKTIEVDTSETVNDQIKELQAKGLQVAVHRYDVNGQFLSEESNIVPEYIISVLNEEGDVNQKTLDEVEKGLATIFLKYQNNQDEVPSKLSEYLGHKYPDYDFNVFLNVPDAWYLNKDYKIELRYELSEWYDSKQIVYSIFALKKESKDSSVSPTIAE